MQRATAPPRRRRAGSSRARLRVAIALLAAAVGLAACSSRPQTLAQQVVAWANGATLSTNDGYLASDVHDIANGIRARQLVATHTACDGLATDAAGAIGDLPTPDAKLTDELNRAYLGLTSAAQLCSDAGGFADDAFRRYELKASVAMAALEKAERRYRSLVR